MNQNKKRVPFLIEERYDLGRLVTFIPNKRVPIHNWYYFKEGFSRDFVFMMFDWFKIKKDDWILDPFCGAGTSLLTSKELGVNAVGIDASPLSVFISQVKTANYDLEKLKNTSKEILSKKFERVKGLEPSSLVKKAFTKGSLEELFFLKEEIRNLTNPQIKNFFTLALINSANLSSYAYKDGGVIKIIKKPVPPLNKMFRRVLKKMIHDVKKTKYSESTIRIHHGDARNMNFLREEYFDFVITSPPYLNNIKYTKIYSIEYELFFENVKIDSLRSYIGLNPKKIKDVFPELKLPEIARAYLQDMQDALLEIHKVMKNGAKFIMVIAEGAFPEIIIPVDILISEMATKIGFEVEKIIIVNNRVVTKDRSIKIGKARESVIVLEK